ncbi:unnamed protein product [Anisakis simplex]|uniref:ATP-binding cassette sub-family B member 6, mitochondrial n=1 Tax=Anisakis simplex TaxID=6269 RepID=A0A0M3K7U0_ANISI|nr:unnamed protein product [Anisakis simplex]
MSAICEYWIARYLGVCKVMLNKEYLFETPFSMDLCYEWKLHKLGICSYSLIVASVLTLLTVINLLFLLSVFFKVQSPTSPRRGYLPFAFVVSCLLNLFLIFIPIGYFLYDRLNVDARAATVTIVLTTHACFWSILLLIRILTRNRIETPWPVVFSELSAVLMAIVPMFFWNSWLMVTRRTVIFTLGMVKNIQKDGHSTTVYMAKEERSLANTSVILPAVAYRWPCDQLDGLSYGYPNIYTLIIVSTLLKFLQGSSVMGGCLYTLRSYLWIPIQQYTTFEIQVELFEHLHNLSLRWHLSRKTGEVLRVMDRGTNSIDGILNYVLFTILPMLADVVIAIMFFFAMFDWYFGVIVFVTMFIYLFVTVLLTEWRTKFRRDMNERENRSRTIGVDSLLNYETVKYYNAEQLEVKRFADSVRWYQKAEWASSASLSLLNLCQNGTIAIALMSGTLLIAYLISLKDSPLTPGDYVLFTTYMLQLYTPLNFFGTVYRVIQQSFIDMENMFELLDEQVEIEDEPNAKQLEVHDGSIVFDNVSFAYTSDRTVLSGISFTVNKGETVALVGPSGAGKSTIVRLLFRLFDVTDGRILFDGQDIRHVKIKSLRKHIGIVPQDTVLFNETIRYNIRFGDPDANNEQVEEAARMAEIHDKIISFPQGDPRYDTMVGERGLKLSGGEKQRVAIARTVLKQPQYILLDEATSALDTATERSIQKCLNEMCQTRTTVIVAHRLSTIVNANRILVIDHGRIVENGTKEAEEEIQLS